MDDLISRQEAIDALNRLCPYPGEWSVNGLGLCKDAIANLPSIDAVQVIRCKDCKYWNPHIKECEGIVNWFGLANEWSENGFCFKGERKEE